MRWTECGRVNLIFKRMFLILGMFSKTFVGYVINMILSAQWKLKFDLSFGRPYNDDWIKNMKSFVDLKTYNYTSVIENNCMQNICVQ